VTDRAKACRSFTAPRDELLIQVRDRGVGIEDLRVIFERSSRPRSQGWGWACDLSLDRRSAWRPDLGHRNQGAGMTSVLRFQCSLTAASSSFPLNGFRKKRPAARWAAGSGRVILTRDKDDRQLGPRGMGQSL